MTVTPRASIVITNYNYDQHVAAAVDAALAQSGVEVIVVDDGSTDDSLAVLERFGEKITLIAQANGGQGAAFNAGFAASSGPFVVFLDADDVLHTGAVDALEAAFADPAIGRVQYPLDLIDERGRHLAGSMPRPGTQLPGGDLRRHVTTFPSDLAWQPTSGNAFRRSVLDEILPMPTGPYRICADYYLSNLSPVHGDVAVIGEPTGSYRVHGANSHFTERWRLSAIRENISRTSMTNQLLIDECRRVGLRGLPDDPDAVRSVTALANRLVSIKIDRGRHPIAADTVPKLVRTGVLAAFGRFDVAVFRRIAMASWFVVASMTPRRWTHVVARPFVRLDLTPGPDGVNG